MQKLKLSRMSFTKEFILIEPNFPTRQDNAFTWKRNLEFSHTSKCRKAYHD